MSESLQLGPLLEPLTERAPADSAHLDVAEGTSSDSLPVPESFVISRSIIPPIPFAVLCLEDYHSDDPIYLSFRKDEILQVLDCDSRSGWWHAKREFDESESYGMIGWIPEAYVQPLMFDLQLPRIEISRFDQEDDEPSSSFDNTDDLEADAPSVLPYLTLPEIAYGIRNRRIRFLDSKETELEQESKLLGYLPNEPWTPSLYDASPSLEAPGTNFAGETLQNRPKSALSEVESFRRSRVQDLNKETPFTVVETLEERIRSARSEMESLQQRIRTRTPELNNNTNSDLGTPTLFNGSEQFSINGGAFNAVGGDIHETTTNSGNMSFFDCIFNWGPRSDPNKGPPSSTTTTTQSQKKNYRKRRWSITKFTHLVQHVYHHYIPAVMYYPMSWIMYYVPWYIPWCQKCAGNS